MRTRIIMIAALCSSLGATAFAAERQTAASPAMQAVHVKQPSMETAIDHLNKAKAILGLAKPTAKLDKDAIGLINKARTNLEAAEGNKGGHRTNAIKLLNQAAMADTNAKAVILIDQGIEEVKKGIAFADNAAAQKAAAKPKPLVQQQMIAAIDHLEKAKAILKTVKTSNKLDKDAIEQLGKAKEKLQQNAGANVGGHREKAVGLINQAVKASSTDSAVKLTDMAMEEVKMGIAFVEQRGK